MLAVPPVLLLGEPTSFLDIAHQLDVLDLVRSLRDQSGTTVVMVLHDLAMAARCADHLVAMSDGRIIAEGPPAPGGDPEVIADVFEVTASVIVDPESGTRGHPPKESVMSAGAKVVPMATRRLVRASDAATPSCARTRRSSWPRSSRWRTSAAGCAG